MIFSAKCIPTEFVTDINALSHNIIQKNLLGHVFFKWSFLLICNFSKSGDLNEEKVMNALIVLVFESTKVTQKGLICHILKERSSYLQYFVTYGHLN